jgi:hypothetical protein
MGLKKGFEPGAQDRIARAGLVEAGFALRALGPSEGLAEEDLFPIVCRFHKRWSSFRHSYMRPLAAKSMDKSQAFFSPLNPA